MSTSSASGSGDSSSSVPPGRGPHGVTGGARTILVVDDDEAIREAVGEVLVDEGYRVLFAENGLRALEILRTRAPAAILLDLMMPVMSGWEVLEAVAESSELARIPIIVLSAMSAPPGHAFLSKPVNLDELLELVGRTCAPQPSSRS
jgi:CheY-like chemotaxis protein